jgi:hypothetical protein
MSPEQTAEERLADRVTALEDEVAELRGAISTLLERVASARVDGLIDELADRRMSQTEMEDAFERFDAVLGR